MAQAAYLFAFETCADGNERLLIGSKRNHIGYLGFKKHISPKSMVNIGYHFHMVKRMFH